MVFFIDEARSRPPPRLLTNVNKKMFFFIEGFPNTTHQISVELKRLSSYTLFKFSVSRYLFISTLPEAAPGVDAKLRSLSLSAKTLRYYRPGPGPAAAAAWPGRGTRAY